MQFVGWDSYPHMQDFFSRARKLIKKASDKCFKLQTSSIELDLMRSTYEIRENKSIWVAPRGIPRPSMAIGGLPRLPQFRIPLVMVASVRIRVSKHKHRRRPCPLNTWDPQTTHFQKSCSVDLQTYVLWIRIHMLFQTIRKINLCI